MEDNSRATRRRYSAEFKAQVLAECEAPGASVAKVAMAHGINDNVVHHWRKLKRDASLAALPATDEFVAVALPPPSVHSTKARGIEVELRRGAVTMKITWPLGAAMDCAAWMRELLR